MRRFLTLLGLAAVLVAGPALAQTTPVPSHTATQVTVAPLAQTALDILVPVAVAVLGSLGTWLGLLLHRKFGLDIEALHRDALQTTLLNAAGLVRARAGKAVEGKSIDVGNPVWAQAIEYVRQSAPQAQAYFNLTPQQIAEKVAAKLPQLDPEVQVEVPGAVRVR